jgi:biopolymer transport protein ExbD
MAKRDLTEINAGSMADIAFLLLVFFLVTTTMDTDYGLARKLPPPAEDVPENDIPLHARDVFEVLANSNDQLLVEGNIMDISELKEAAKEFIVNPGKKIDLPVWEDISVGLAKQKIAEYTSKNNVDATKKWEKRLAAAEVLGSYTLTKQVISLKNDRGTSYDTYIQIQNELAAAYNELRNDLSQTKFGVSYDDLTDRAKDDKKNPELKAKIKAIRTVYPQKISEAEPNSIE